jgi:AcrR family transcriptional regulator
MRRASASRASDSGTTDHAKALLNATRTIFVQEGLGGLSVRRVAELAGCTTMLVYSRFGGKEGLIGAMFDEGFAALAQAQQAVPKSLEPRARVLALCQAYLGVAHKYPHHYALMLGTQSGAFKPSETSHARAMATLDHLVAAVRATLPAGARRPANAAVAAHRILAFCHGWLMLEQIGPLRARSNNASFLRGLEALLDHP